MDDDDLIVNIDAKLNVSRPLAVDIQFKFYNIFIPVLSITIVCINLIIVLSSGLLLHRGQLHPRSTYIFLGNVAMADLLIGVATIYGHFYPHDKRTEMQCCISVGMTVSSILASVYCIGLIAIDRYLYILYGLRYKRYISSKRARLMVLATWLLGIIVGYLPAMGIRNPTDNGRHCWFIILAPPGLVMATTTIGILPLMVIIVLYSIILKHALNKIGELKDAENRRGTEVGGLRLFRGGGHGSRASALDDNSVSGADGGITYLSVDNDKPPKRRRNLLKFWKRSETLQISTVPVYNPSRWKAIKIVMYTTGAYFITWFPYFFASTLYAMCDQQKTPVYCDNLKVAIASPLTILGFFNSILNPIIYAWWHNGFRESIKKTYRAFKMKRCAPKLNDFKLNRTSTNIARSNANITSAATSAAISRAMDSSASDNEGYQSEQNAYSPVPVQTQVNQNEEK